MHDTFNHGNTKVSLFANKPEIVAKRMIALSENDFNDIIDYFN